jgi:hypothetical protein
MRKTVFECGQHEDDSHKITHFVARNEELRKTCIMRVQLKHRIIAHNYKA